MKLFAVTLLALVLGTIQGAPLFAADTAPQDTVMKTFQLTVYGEVPPGEMFSVGGTGINMLVLCSDSTTPCQGNGTVYTATLDYPVGTTATFRFIRNEHQPTAREVFAEFSEVLNSDTTSVASYTVGEQTAPTLTLSPTTGTDGTTITYQGTGYTPGGDVTVLVTGDGLVVAETQADANSAIEGSFVAPRRERLTGVSGNSVPVFTIDETTGQQSLDATFTYVQPGQLPDTGASVLQYGVVMMVLAGLLAGGYLLRRWTPILRTSWPILPSFDG